MKTNSVPKYLIVGGVAGGATAAARIRRNTEQAEIILFEKGEHISYANCGLPYYIGGVIEERERLFVQTPEAFDQRFAIDVRTRSEVTSIDLKNKKNCAIIEYTQNEFSLINDIIELNKLGNSLKIIGTITEIIIPNNKKKTNGLLLIIISFSFKVCLWMSTNWTYFWSFFSNYNVSTVSTLPNCIAVF